MNLLDSVRLELTQVNSQKTKKWSDEEIYYFLDKAQVRFVLMHIEKKRNSDFEHDIMDAPVVEPFIKVSTTTLQPLNLPSDYNFFIACNCLSNDVRKHVRLVSNHVYSLTESIPYIGSNGKSLIGQIIENKIQINPHKKQDVIKDLTLVYIRNIELVSKENPTLQVKSIYYKSVIDLAVLAAMETTSNSNSEYKQRDITKNITIN